MMRYRLFDPGGAPRSLGELSRHGGQRTGRDPAMALKLVDWETDHAQRLARVLSFLNFNVTTCGLFFNVAGGNMPLTSYTIYGTIGFSNQIIAH